MISTNPAQDASVYVGDELELFNHAKNWKNYWGVQIKSYLGTRILEVGAGIGATPFSLMKQNVQFDKWVCIEPDARLSSQILEKSISQKENRIEVFTGLLQDYTAADQFDSILYIDVIEHIEDEKAELVRALNFLKPGGKLIIVVPAHQYLYSEFDKAIGHFRRYNRKMLAGALPAGCSIVKNRYLDSLGLLASLANKLFLRQSYPTIKQITFWDSVIVPVSKLFDPLFFSALESQLF